MAVYQDTTITRRPGQTPSRAKQPLKRGYVPPISPRESQPHKLEPTSPLVVPRRLGSRQVVSVRGRRVQPIKEVPRALKISIVAVVVGIVGIVLAMGLSGLATQQTFVLQDLKSEETALDNKVETLNRDLENFRSSAELARRSADMHLVVPDQPGVLEVNGKGEVHQVRPAKPEGMPLADVNGKAIRPHRASSNPDKIKEIDGTISAVPQIAGPVPGVAPYAPNVPATP